MARLGLYNPSGRVPAGYVLDAHGKLWPSTGLVRCGPNGEPCYDHAFDFDQATGTVYRWESDDHPERYPKGWPVSPAPKPPPVQYFPDARPPATPGQGALRGFNDGPVEQRTLGVIALVVLGVLAARRFA